MTSLADIACATFIPGVKDRFNMVDGGHAAAATFADLRAHSVALGADNCFRSLEQVTANQAEVDKLSAAWHAAHGSGHGDDATEAENVAAIASARAGLVRADHADSSEAEVAAATDAAAGVIANCRPLSLAGSVDLMSLMIQAGGTTFIDNDLLAGLVNLRAALARLDSEADCDAMLRQGRAV